MQSTIPIEVLGLAPNLVDYRAALALQEETAAAVAAGTTHGKLFLLEHPAVYTAGRRATDPSEYPTDDTPIVEVNRGGRVTWHGPGQLIGYPVVHLSNPRGLVLYVRSIERMLMATFADLGIPSRQFEGNSGVWTDEENPSKLAQIGIHVTRGVTTHGFSVNCNPDLEVFHRFIPCGIRDHEVTSLTAVSGRTITPADLVPVITPRLHDFLDEVADQ